MASGMWMTVTEIIIIVIAGIILFVLVIAFLGPIGTADFGSNCYFTFVEYNLINSFFNPLSSLASDFGIHFSAQAVTSPQVQASCLQITNVNAHSTMDFGEQLYGMSASCFHLFTGSNQQTGQEVLSDPNLNNLFNCFTGRIFNYETTAMTNYSDLIKFIDKNYFAPQDPLQISIITNGSNNIAQYPSLSSKIYNNSVFSISYFEFPTLLSEPPGFFSVFGGAQTQLLDCQINFRSACYATTAVGQPFISGSQCSYQNDTVLTTDYPISSLSLPVGSFYSSDNLITGPCAANYTVPFCGVLLNTMIGAQNRVFICVVNGS